MVSLFSELLRDLRAKKRFSQKQLAEAVGVSPGNVSDWESGKTRPGYAALAALSRCFEVSADYLLELTPGDTGGAGDELRRLEQFKQEQGLACGESPLTVLEADLVAMFRLLPSLEQEDVFDIIYLKYKRHAEGKKGSIYWTYFDESSGENGGPARGYKAHDGTA